jgi:hypothetical protein
LTFARAEPWNFDDDIGTPPKIRYREYSFLQNERTPKTLKVHCLTL